MNGWITSHSMHKPTLFPCLLVCAGAQDYLSHYVQCPRVYAASKFVVSDTSAEPLIRLGLVHPHKGSLLICACVFSGYHGLKASIRNASSATSDLDFWSNWCLFAQHFNAEAVRCGLSATLFAPSRFLEFLHQQDALHDS